MQSAVSGRVSPDRLLDLVELSERDTEHRQQMVRFLPPERPRSRGEHHDGAPQTLDALGGAEVGLHRDGV